MVNMNHYEEPAVYALVAPDGGLFYVGRTSINAQNRLWQHIHRARSGHDAPVYRRMREVGYEQVTYEILHLLQPSEDGRMIEAQWIQALLESGHDLVNAYGQDGVPDSWNAERRQIGMPSRKGKPTWIKGKTGEEAGWTEERRRIQSEAAKERQAARHVPKHGTRNEHDKWGCRCEECVAFNDRQEARKEGRPVQPKTERVRVRDQHGTVAGYKHGKCRCDACASAYREYQKRFRK